MIDTVKPGSPEELVHAGVKGMRWGVRRSRETQKFHQKHPTREARDKAIARARNKVHSNKSVADDNAVALRLTSGEKFTASLIALTGVGALPVAAFIGINTGVRRSYEKESRREKSL